VRKSELDTLVKLPPPAALYWIAVRFGRTDADAFSFGCRKFERFGLNKSSGCRFLSLFVEHGLLKLEYKSGYLNKRRQSIYRFCHTKDSEEKQSHKRDKRRHNRPVMRTVSTRPVPQTGQKYDEQSQRRDNTKDTSSTSSRKSKEEEVSLTSSEEEKQRSLSEQKARARCIGKLANALQMEDYTLMRKAGGPSEAGKLADCFEKGELALNEIRKKINEFGSNN
jgi:hypothetical protein